jgi:hypothetical protein
MKFSSMLVKFPCGGPVGESATSARELHNFLSERARGAELELPIILRTEEADEGTMDQVFISAGEYGPAVLNWIREWRAKNPTVAHSIQTPEGLPDDDFRKEIRAK